MGRPASDKKERLVQAAINHFHRNGYANTSLADLSADTGISLGNTFYYFKAKSDLAKAVIDAWCAILQGHFDQLKDMRNPKKRIVEFIHNTNEQAELYVSIGCPLAALTRDLSSEGEAMRKEVKRIYAIYYAWLEQQFNEIGFQKKDAVAHSRFLMAGLQGAILLSHAQQDGSLLADEIKALSHWLKELNPSKFAFTRKSKNVA